MREFYLIKKSPYGKSNTKIGRKLIADFDKGNMPYETGKYLEAIFNNEEYIMGIHRTGLSPATPRFIAEVFDNGIKNLGDRMQGMISRADRNIEKIVSLFDNFPLLIGQIKDAYKYKASQGVFVVKIPKSYIGVKEGEVKPIYFNDGGTMYLLPEFICGFIPVSEAGTGGFIPNPNYSDFHTYKSDGLVYDISVENKIKAKPDNIVYF